MKPFGLPVLSRSVESSAEEEGPRARGGQPVTMPMLLAALGLVLVVVAVVILARDRTSTADGFDDEERRTITWPLASGGEALIYLGTIERQQGAPYNVGVWVTRPDGARTFVPQRDWARDGTRAEVLTRGRTVRVIEWPSGHVRLSIHRDAWRAWLSAHPPTDAA